MTSASKGFPGVEPFRLDLEVGECFDRLESPDVSEVPAVPCDEPADLEVFGPWRSCLRGTTPETTRWVTTATAIRDQEAHRLRRAAPERFRPDRALPPAGPNGATAIVVGRFMAPSGYRGGRLGASVQGSEPAEG